MLFASIDIGSNAIRLLFANVYENDNIANAAKATLVRIPLRLGEDVFKIGKISEPRILNLIKTMEAFKLLIEVYNPVAYETCATSAMREASNKEEIVERVFTETGMKIKVIDGMEEAAVIRGSNNMDFKNEFKTTMYIDVGGGSTEVSVLKDHKFKDCNSFNLGAVRLLNKRVEEEEWDNMKSWLKGFRSDFGRINCVGTGGNINRLAKLFGNQIDNSLTFTQLRYAYKTLKEIPLKQRIEKMGLRPDRADVIVPAAKIYIEIMKAANIETIVAPRVGLADGLIYKMYDEYKRGKR